MPGTRLTPAQLDQVRELHGAVRKWLEDSALAQKSEHIRANLPYADLMFAFGFATLGDHPTANKLVEDARKVMEGPIPEGGSPQADQAIAAAVASNFLFKALRYRVEQALSGQPHNGPLSESLTAAREAILTSAKSGPVNHPYKLASLVVDRLRDQSRILEPSERVDPFDDWTKHGDAMKWELVELHAIRDPAALAARIRKLCGEGVPDKPLKEVQFYTLHEALPLAVRVGEAFGAELLERVPEALYGGAIGGIEPPDLSKKQGELLQRALFLAGHFNRADVVKKLVDEFTALVRSKPAETRHRLINVAARQGIRSLNGLGLTSELDRFLTRLHGEALDGLSVVEVKKKYALRPEAWAAVLQTLLNIAGGWTFLGFSERGAPILAEARNELLSPSDAALQPHDYTGLARAYVACLGTGSPEVGLPAMIELFRKMKTTRINNVWTTAHYYSRFHLNLVEDAVLAIVAK